MYTEEEIEAYLEYCRFKVDQLAKQGEMQIRLYQFQYEIYAERIRQLAKGFPYEETQKTS